ncbi:MAG: hypothetical protein WC985_02440 [Thermoplasmata archaeon]
MKRAMALCLVLLAALLSFGTVPAPARAEGASLSVSPTEGPPGTTVSVTGEGFPPAAPVDIVWHTMEGNRVSGSGFTPVGWTITTAVANAQGGLTASFVAPYDLGGPPHRVEAVVGSASAANASFTLTRRAWITPTEGPEGTVVTIRLVAGGWTQYDNNVAITYDNAFLGFACSFNSQGNITLWLQATGGVGPHVIGVYPALFYGPSDGPTPWKHPALNPDDLPVRYEPELFTFTITEGSGGRSYDRGTDLREVTAPDSLLLPNVPAQAVQDGTAHLAVGNGAKGVAGGDLPWALAGFPAGARVDIRWNTVVGETQIGGTLGDKFLGWVYTPTNWTLTTVVIAGDGTASGLLRVPFDYGGLHTIEAVVDGQVLAVADWMTVPRFTASLGADGRSIELSGTGLGWEKYTSVWDILYDNQLMGWVAGMISGGNVNVTIPIVGGPGIHTLEIHEGSNGWPYLNMHESPWPWEPVYRFAFTILEPDSGAALEANILLWALPPLFLAVAVIGFVGGRIHRTRVARKSPK